MANLSIYKTSKIGNGIFPKEKEEVSQNDWSWTRTEDSENVLKEDLKSFKTTKQTS